MNYRTFSTAMLLVAVFCSAVGARTWTSQNGKFTLEAELVGVKQGRVFLKKTNGQEISVPIEKLSEQDQEFLKEQQENQPPMKTVSVEQALNQEVSYQFLETPLKDVVSWFRRQTGVNFYISERSLHDVGVGTDQPITAKGDKVEVRTALEEILKPAELTHVPQGEVIVITSEQYGEIMLDTRAYQATRKVVPDEFIEEVTQRFDPDSWSDVGGPGTISPLPISVFIITQQDEVHRKIAAHYKDLLRPLTVPAMKPRVKEQRKPTVDEILDQSANSEMIDTPLRDVIEYFSKVHGVSITLDKLSLENEGIGADVPVTLNLKDVPLRTVLDFIVEPFGLTWIVEKNEVKVTSRMTAEKSLQKVSYPMKKLARGSDLRVWADMITSAVAPHTWDRVGGLGSIKPKPDGALEVSQNYHVHRQISQLLAAIGTAK